MTHIILLLLFDWKFYKNIDWEEESLKWSNSRFKVDEEVNKNQNDYSIQKISNSSNKNMNIKYSFNKSIKSSIKISNEPINESCNEYEEEKEVTKLLNEKHQIEENQMKIQFILKSFRELKILHEKSDNEIYFIKDWVNGYFKKSKSKLSIGLFRKMQPYSFIFTIRTINKIKYCTVYL